MQTTPRAKGGAWGMIFCEKRMTTTFCADEETLAVNDERLIRIVFSLSPSFRMRGVSAQKNPGFERKPGFLN
jgi:hypothetical protein